MISIAKINLLIRQGDLNAAEKELTKAIEVNTDNPTLLSLYKTNLDYIDCKKKQSSYKNNIRFPSNTKSTEAKIDYREKQFVDIKKSLNIGFPRDNTCYYVNLYQKALCVIGSKSHWGRFCFPLNIPSSSRLYIVARISGFNDKICDRFIQIRNGRKHYSPMLTLSCEFDSKKGLTTYVLKNETAKSIFVEFRSPGKSLETVFEIKDVFIKAHPPTVSVIVPYFNDKDYIIDCLLSLEAQTYPNVEIVVVDDCSQDKHELHKLIESVALNVNLRVVRHEENKGLAAARNTGLREATGDFVCFMDSDDFYESNSILRRVNEILNNTNGLKAGSFDEIRSTPESVTFDSFVFSSEEREKRIVSLVDSAGTCPFNCHAPLVWRHLILEVNGFAESMQLGAEDYHLWYRLMRSGYQFHSSGREGCVYRQKKNSMARRNQNGHYHESNCILKSAYADDFTPTAYFISWDYYICEGLSDFKLKIEKLKRGITSAVMQKLSNHSLHSFSPYNISDALAGLENRHRPYIDVFNHVIAGIRRINFSDAPSSVEVNNKLHDLYLELSSITDDHSNTKKRGQPVSVNQENNEESPLLPDANEISYFKNFFPGERCFILGNGPSLNLHDLSLLENEHSFAVNGIFYKTRECGYRPSFYVVEDSSVMKENISDIILYQPKLHKFFPTIYKNMHPKDARTSFFRMNRGFYDSKSEFFETPRFSENAAERLYCGQSVTIINLQLAFYMGFKYVYLIGMDFSYAIPSDAKVDGAIITSNSDDPNHFHSDYFGKGKTWKDPKLRNVEASYANCNVVYQSHGREIINASIGGKLEVFRRQDWNDLF